LYIKIPHFSAIFISKSFIFSHLLTQNSSFFSNFTLKRYEKFAVDGGSTATVSKSEFIRGFSELGKSGETGLGEAELEEIYNALDVDQMGKLDYIE
jgi:hypothetical protein